jgi:hypothetical protein
VPFVTIHALEISTPSQSRFEMSEQKLVFQTRAPADAAEIRLIAELTDCYHARLARQDAMYRLQQIILRDRYKTLVKAADSASQVGNGQSQVESTPSQVQDGP